MLTIFVGLVKSVSTVTVKNIHIQTSQQVDTFIIAMPINIVGVMRSVTKTDALD